ncbi:MAG: hypothetical protein IPH38_17895 [Candidatus Microthrix sp.]|nr:hypothetical protein [Candidatus Microthrix sp.]MBK7021405.1 hypothetical protein [Candidatus Microthrix sp.]
MALDDRLALAATLPRRNGRNELVAVHVRVRRAEEVAAEVSRPLRQPALPGDGGDPLEQVADDLTVLSEARRVVNDVSRNAQPAPPRS